MKKIRCLIHNPQIVIFLLLFCALNCISPKISAQYITTDKFAYSNGQTVTFNGSGFDANELVDIAVNKFYAPPLTPVLFFTISDINCDISGNFTISYNMYDQDFTFQAVARGQTSRKTAEVVYQKLPRVVFQADGLPDNKFVRLRLTYTDRHNKLVNTLTEFEVWRGHPVIPFYPGTSLHYYDVNTPCGFIFGNLLDCYGFEQGTPSSPVTPDKLNEEDFASVLLHFCQIPRITSAPEEITVVAPEGSCSAVVYFTGANEVVATGYDEIYGPITITYNPVSGTAFPVGTTQVTGTARNECGGELIYHFDVIVTETEPPAFLSNFPASRTISALPGECYNTPTWPAPGATDNCPGSVTVEQIAGLASGSNFPVGDNVITYRATDVSGNKTEKSFTITIKDNQAPVAPADFTTPVECPQQTSPVVLKAHDNCDGEIPGYVVETISTYDPKSCEGDIVRKYSFTDEAGNISYSYHTFKIDRTIPPQEVNGPVNNSGGTVECFAAATPPNLISFFHFPEVRDACGNLIPAWKSMRMEGTYTNNCPGREGTVIYVYTYEDCTGLTFDWRYTYNIIRTTPPHIVPFYLTLPTSKTISCPSQAATPTTPMVEDVCGIPVSLPIPKFDGTWQFGDCDGTIIYIYTFKDCAGKELIWSFTYTIVPDVLTILPNQTNNVDCVGEAVQPDAPPAVSDGCGGTVAPTGPTVQENIVDGTGIKTYTWKYTDCTGKEYFWTFTYNIKDLTPPNVTCPSIPVLVDNKPGTCYAEFDLTNLTDFPQTGFTYSDACSEARLTKIDSDWSYESGNIRRLTVGNHTIKVLVVDLAGNESTCEYPLTVVDKDPPVITCPPDKVLGTNRECRHLGTFGDATATDLCSNPRDIIISNNAPPDFSLGETLVEWKATDTDRNQSTCIQKITVEDDDPPQINCPADITQNADAGSCGAIVSFEATATDNCSSDITYSKNPGTFFPVGNTVVTATATDPAGNKTECSFNVTVVNTAPVIESVTPDVALIPVNSVVTLTIVATDAENNISGTNIAWGDGVSGTVYSHTYTTTGVYKVDVTVTDYCDLSDSKAFEYIVVYDPSEGFVTGGGWINSPEGAYIDDLTLTGRANFGFVSKYKKGQVTPDGNTEFQFKAGNLNFKSTAYEWLVIAGAKAIFKGSGTINGLGNYGFQLSAVDAALTSSTLTDKFRIKIWDKDNGDAVVYDNNMNLAENADPTTEIAGGSIVIHSEKNKSGFIEPVTEYVNLKVYPNPFSESLRFEFISPKAVNAKIEVFDITGRKIETIFDNQVEKGILYNASFKPEKEVSAMYFYRMFLGENEFNGKAIYKAK